MRVVTLLPSATEIVAAVGGESLIVGISHECDTPAGIVDRPRLTTSTLPDDLGTRAIDTRIVQAMISGEPLYVVEASRLEALKPDLIVTQDLCKVCALTPTQIGMVDAMTDVPMVSLSGTTFAGVLTDIAKVGQALGLEAEAADLAESLQERWNALARPDPAGPRVLFAEWPDPLWLAGHWVPELIAAAGGIDPYGTVGAPSVRGSWSEALAKDPDLVVFGACGYDLVANVESARVVPTGRARRYAIDANRLTSRPGPRLVEGLEVLRAVIADDLEGIDSNAVRALAPVG